MINIKKPSIYINILKNTDILKQHSVCLYSEYLMKMCS